MNESYKCTICGVISDKGHECKPIKQGFCVNMPIGDVMRDAARRDAAEKRVKELEAERDEFKAMAHTAFVQGADWARFKITGFTSFESERDEAAAVAKEKFPYIPRAHEALIKELEAERDALKRHRDDLVALMRRDTEAAHDAVLSGREVKTKFGAMLPRDAIAELVAQRDSLKARLAAAGRHTSTETDLQKLIDAAASFLSITLMVTGDRRGMSMTLFREIDGKTQFVAASIEFKQKAEDLAKMIGLKIKWPEENLRRRKVTRRKNN